MTAQMTRALVVELAAEVGTGNAKAAEEGKDVLAYAEVGVEEGADTRVLEAAGVEAGSCQRCLLVDQMAYSR